MGKSKKHNRKKNAKNKINQSNKSIPILNGLNQERRKRQSKENAWPVLEKVIQDCISKTDLAGKTGRLCIDNPQKIEELITSVEQETILIARTIEPDWAIPILIEIISNIYYGVFAAFMIFGTSFKRAVAYLWDNHYHSHGEQRNVGQVAKLIKRCHVLEQLYGQNQMYTLDSSFFFFYTDGYVEIPERFVELETLYLDCVKARGTRFRTAKDNTGVILHFKEYYNAIDQVMHGSLPSSIDLFQGTFYEFIPGVEDAECRKFWENLYVRYIIIGLLIYANPDDLPTDTLLFREFPVVSEFPLSQSTISNIFWTKDWFCKKDKCRYGNLLVERPLVRIHTLGEFATSIVLMLDSINNFVERQLLKYPSRFPTINLPDFVFRKAVSEPFEDNCIQFFRENGFLAGHVVESGVWKTQEKNIMLKSSAINLYGEIDVLAFHPKAGILFLVECKVLNDIEDYRTLRNLKAKIKDDSEGFRKKLKEKENWLADAFPTMLATEMIECQVNYQGLCSLLVTDIPFPFESDGCDNIYYTNYIQMKGVVARLLSLYQRNPEN